jgi:hypothetical protein
MLQSFEIQLKKGASDFIEKAQSSIKNTGGTWKGDERCGNIKIHVPLGNIVGSYEIIGSQLIVHIHEKPFLVSTSKIRSLITEHIG